MKKRLISLLLALVMVLALIPAMAPEVQAADFYWMQVSQMDDYPDGYMMNMAISRVRNPLTMTMANISITAMAW